MSNQQNDLTWRETDLGPVPISTRYDDPYYSLDNGLAEAEHVFIAGNDRANRFAGPIRIAELGFGTGLNFLATIKAWKMAGHGQPLTFTSFEGFPLTRDAAAAALTAFPEVEGDATTLLNIWEAAHRGPATYAPGVTVHIITGDVRDSLPTWEARADAWYLDGFSPAKNPDMWEASLMHAVADHTTVGGTVATYTAAGHVRRAKPGVRVI
ncbi:MAG: tRNA (5-methylaminomethyl-2-thiouridine)(34)-methyltransferase MnmD [Pseudomonadota bacterium]